MCFSPYPDAGGCTACCMTAWRSSAPPLTRRQRRNEGWCAARFSICLTCSCLAGAGTALYTPSSLVRCPGKRSATRWEPSDEGKRQHLKCKANFAGVAACAPQTEQRRSSSSASEALPLLQLQRTSSPISLQQHGRVQERA